MRVLRGVSVWCVGLTVGLTGCLSTTRAVKKIQLAPPEAYRKASAEEIEQKLATQNQAIKTLNAQVLVTATTGGSNEGKEKEYTSLKGYISLQQPEHLRVILQVPVIGSRAMDMVSDGKSFTLMHASTHGDVWMQGSNEVTEPSKNGLENLRPGVFLNSLLVTPVTAEEFVTLTSSSREIAPETRRHDAVMEPTYELAISKVKKGHVLQRERVIHINRLTLQPYGQDIYNDAGQIDTQASYEKYKPYQGQQFPSLITIKRPLDEYSLKIEIVKLTLNEEFEADQFELPVPAGVVVKKMP